MHNSASVGGGKMTGGKLMLHSIASGAGKEGPEGLAQVTSVRYLDLAIGTVLCVSSTNGTSIYNEDASSLILFVPMDAVPVAVNDSDVLKHHQGACVVPMLQHIVIGTSKGTLMVVQAAQESFVALPESVPSGEVSEVADVCFATASNHVVTAHNSGELRLWSAAEIPYVNTSIVPPTREAPVRIASLGARLLVAYGPGTICLYDVVSWQLQVEITAHARWITAVEVREDTGQIASVGEDTVLNVWEVAPTGQVSLQHSSIVADKLLTGVAFAAFGMAITAYDSETLFIVPIAG